MLSLSQLFVHPVKSLRGLQLSHAQVDLPGLAFDRTFMLTDPDGTFITARQYPQLVLLTPALLPDGLLITTPDGSTITISLSDFAAESHPTEVWGNHFTALVASAAINQWFSRYLQREVQLRWVGPELTRRVKNRPEIPLTFTDGSPLMLINEGSLRDLQQRCPSSVRLEQLRPNLLVSGADAYAEDHWQVLRIGDILFEVIKPCSRCILTTVSVESGRKHPNQEPLRTLQSYRTDANGKVDFGINLLARSRGILRFGDSVEILSTKQATGYQPQVLAEEEKRRPAKRRHQTVNIRYNDVTFVGNNQETILEQLEQQGLRIPYSCRAGLCGSCRITLVNGEVNLLKLNALGADNRLLACSCLPDGDIELAL